MNNGKIIFSYSGLSWAISEHLAKTTKCFTLYATHFHEITNLADSLPNVKNYHLASMVDNDKLTLLFKVKPGAMTKSFGIQVAEIAQLPATVVFSAKKYLNDLECSEFKTDNKYNAEKCAKIDQLLENIKKEKDFDISSFLSLI